MAPAGQGSRPCMIPGSAKVQLQPTDRSPHG